MIGDTGRQETARCRRCGTRLAADNSSALCAACQRWAREQFLQAPEVPEGFWDDQQMREALACRDMALVSRAYRHHPHHGRHPLSQDRLAAWLGLTQGQLSRIERGENQVRDLDALIHWARTLRLPSHLAWFHVPRDQVETPIAVTNGLKGYGQEVRAEHVASLSRPGRSGQSNLPCDVTPFFGRELDVDAVNSLLKQHRLVTLIGHGGVGKTRLAIQVARGQVERAADGVWWVELGALPDADLVPRAVAAAVGVDLVSDRSLRMALTDALHPLSLLLVLDNCEHLSSDCAHLIEALLRACPRLQISATSREPLACAGEALWDVAPLPLPPADVTLMPAKSLMQLDSVRLFVDRATASRPAFALTEANASALAEICRRLDGLPLAIELAAALVRLLSVEQIATRLDDRFRLLTGGNRTAHPRQRTLQTLVDWSYDLLSLAEQVLFNRLSVFTGGFMLEAAEAVGQVADVSPHGAASDDLPQAESVLSLLRCLVDKSLVARNEGNGQQGEGRFRLLETLREYGRQHLAQAGDEDRVGRLHLDYYLGLVERAVEEATVTGGSVPPSGTTWRATDSAIDPEGDNLRAALRWAGAHPNSEMDGRLSSLLSNAAERLALPAVRRTLTPLIFELRRLGQPAYETLKRRLMEQSDPAVIASGADLYRVVGDRQVELVMRQALVKAEPNEAAREAARVSLARLLITLNDPLRAAVELETVGTWAAQRHEDLLHLDVTLEGGYAHFMTGDCSQGLRAYDAGLALLEQLRGEPAETLRREAYRAKELTALLGRGCVLHNMDANEACVSSHRAALALAIELGDIPRQCLALINLADALWGCHRCGEALNAYRQALRLAETSYYTEGIELGHIGSGIVLWSIGRDEAAASALERGLALARDLNSSWDIGYGLAYLSNVQASLGNTTTALRTNREAVTHAMTVGAGYPLSLARFYLLWKLESAHPTATTHRSQLDEALREARGLGLDGLAMCLAWLRLLHRAADPAIPDRLLGRELHRRLQTLSVRLPVKAPWESLGRQIVRTIREHGRAIDVRPLEAAVERVFLEKLTSLDQADQQGYRDAHERHARWP